MKQRPLHLFLAVSALTLPALGQPSPYAGLEGRDIKALSTEEIDGLLAGEGLGFAMAAELNGYPGPKHVLEMAAELELSDAQRRATQDAFDRMHAKAVELGKSLVERERELDRLFADHRADLAETERLTREVGLLRGELRAVHLKAHLEMVDILTMPQRHKYVTTRGYHHGGHHGHGAHHGHHGSSHDG